MRRLKIRNPWLWAGCAVCLVFSVFLAWLAHDLVVVYLNDGQSSKQIGAIAVGVLFWAMAAIMAAWQFATQALLRYRY